MIVDAHVHLLPDRLAAAIRGFFDERMTPGLVSQLLVYPPGHAEVRRALVAAGVDRCWSLPYAHKPGVARELNRWMAETFADDPVVVHVGHADDGTATSDEIAPIARVARRWPEARVVVAHCGAPAVEATLALLREARSLCADLTPIGWMLAPVTRAALAGLESRLLFGSDAPNTGVTVEQGVAFVRGLGLDAGAEAEVLGGNAERLLSTASSPS